MAPSARKQLVKNETAKFQICDVVFAKLKGSPLWPAQVTKIKGNICTVVYFGTYQWSNNSANTLFKIGPKENNPVVETNKKNASFMRAWDECIFILETLFQDDRRENANESVAAIKPSNKQKPIKIETETIKKAPAIPNVCKKPLAEGKVTRAKTKLAYGSKEQMPQCQTMQVQSGDQFSPSLPSSSIESESLETVTRKATAKSAVAIKESIAKCTKSIIKSGDGSLASSSTSENASMANVTHRVTRVTAKLAEETEESSVEYKESGDRSYPSMASSSSNRDGSVANITRRVTRATAKLSKLATEKSAPKCQSSDAKQEMKKKDSSSVKTAKIPRRVTRAMKKSTEGMPLNEVHVKASRKRKAESGLISDPKKKK